VEAGLRATATSARAKPSGRWLVGARIEAFRGIPGRLELDFGSAGRAPAVVVLGDNGSGKSSIVDALQFALQLQLRGASGEAALPLAQCGLVQVLPSITVHLSDGVDIERRVWNDGDRLRITPDPPDDFRRTPLVLRRSDILRFWETPAEFRQLLFVHFFSGGQAPAELPQEREMRLKAAEMQAKAERRGARTKLARLLGASPVTVPTESKAFSDWVNANVYGWNPNTRRRTFRDVPQSHRSAVDALRSSIKRLDLIKKELDDPTPHSIGRPNELAAVLREASADVTRSFRAISPSRAVSAIEMTCGEATAMDLTLTARLSNGQDADPGTILSEANRDLVAFLVFVAIARAAASHGQARVMILDDVFQSVDGPIRVAALDHVVSQLPGWQFVLTAHDRLWQEQLVTILRRHGHPVRSYEIVGWSPGSGPDLRAKDGKFDSALRSAMDAGDPSAVALHAGRLLEQLCHELSWTLPVSVTRRRDDRYTLGDLWPSVYKRLKTTNAFEAADEVERYIHLRNLLGAHVNEWAQSASLGETSRFGQAVLDLLLAIQCAQCGRWVEASPEAHTYVCRCGATRLIPRAMVPAAHGRER
jgi:hypothetical protein